MSDGDLSPLQIPLFASQMFSISQAAWLNIAIEYAPFCAAGASTILLTVYYGITTWTPWGRKQATLAFGERQRFFDALRISATITLVATSVVQHRNDSKNIISPNASRGAFSAATDAYLFLIAVLAAAVPAGSHWNIVLVRAVSVVSFVGVVASGMQNLPPLVVFSSEESHDSHASLIIWTRFAVLGLLGVILPAIIPRVFYPRNMQNPSEPIPEQRASLISLITYSYLNPLISLAYKLPSVPLEKLPGLGDDDESRLLYHNAVKFLDIDKGLGKRGVAFALVKVFRRDLGIMALMSFIESLASFMSPLALNRLLHFLEEGVHEGGIRPWVWILCLISGPVTLSLTNQWYNFVATRVSVRAEAILTQALYEHSLRTRPISSSIQTHNGNDESPIFADKKLASKASGFTGRLNNLATTDLPSIIKAKDLVSVIIKAPTQLAICMAFLLSVLGTSSLAGLCAIIFMIPVSWYTGEIFHSAQKTMMQKTDARVQTVSENLNILRLIKMFAWERKIYDRISEKRVEELVWIRKAFLLRVVNGMTNLIASQSVMVLTFGTRTLILKQPLTPSMIFSSMPVFRMLQMLLHLVFGAAMDTSVAITSLTRLTEFFTETPLLDSAYGIDLVGSSTESEGVGLCNNKFSWANDDQTSSDREEAFTLQIEAPLKFRQGALNLILGPTGSGKSSLLSAILGEMKIQGKVNVKDESWNSLPREHGVAYAPQEPWIQNATIRDNIVFQSSYEPSRYQTVLDQCGLVRDLELFDAGDQTEIGEKGISLSGGQKARISLARAAYSSASILLLDDVFSALDVHTSRYIVDSLFRGSIISGRTVLLVTHAVSLLAPVADFVISLRGGRVMSAGSFQEVIASDSVVAEEAKENMRIASIQSGDEKNEDTPKEENATAENGAKKGVLIASEEMNEGRVGISAWKMYFSQLGRYPPLVVIPCLGGFLVSSGTQTFQARFIGQWGAEYENHDPEDLPLRRYFAIYSLFLVAALSGTSISFISGSIGAIRASRVLHERLVLSVFGSTMRWFDTTPMSRIVTRCTQDMKSVDTMLPNHLMMITQFATFMFVSFCAVIAVSPAFILPAAVLALIGFGCGHVYMKAQLSTKRFMSNAKAPILAHLDASVAGLSSIRAYGVQEAFKGKSFDLIDKSTRVSRTFHSLTRWANLRVDVVGATFSALLAVYLVYFKSRDASSTGFSLLMASQFSSMILMFVQSFNNLEIEANSLERIEQYLNIEQEPKSTPEKQPPAYWPASGRLQAQNLSAKYSSDGPEVLHSLSFDIKSGERVGVVGRTGSGKSSLTLSLLRCIPTEGEVYFDGLPTSSINLESLRTAITIIPQMPELLSGTIRENLDPSQEHDDASLNDALRASGMSSVSHDKAITLDTSVSAGATNLSFGQRQMVALARALARQSKLLILDEATSGIDYETDTIIQHSLRTRLPKDVTVLTIAHRLQTIMDADKIMVLDAGKIVEYDSPKALLEKSDSKFKTMVDRSTDKEALYASVV